MLKKRLGNRIADLRRWAGLTQQQLAEKCDYSVEFISLLERGINSPSLEGLERLAAAFAVPIRDLFDFPEESHE